ncbi:MAG: hypothetical protein K1W17_00100 [Oscillospiraceae bacterium]
MINERSFVTLDYFSLHHKILSICEDLMSVRRRIEKLTPAEMEYAITILERLKKDIENNNITSPKGALP